MKAVIAVLLVGSALTLAACGGDEEAAPAEASTPAASATPASTPPASPPASAGKPAPSPGQSVAIEDFAFAPKAIQAKVGERITWSNDDAAAHTVTAKSGGELNSGTLAQGDSYWFTPEKAGTIEYFCEIHPSMVGTIEVS